MAFTDGRTICAALDRNGLRPSRYYITQDDTIVLASEVGVVDLDPATIVKKRPSAAGQDAGHRYCSRPHHRQRRDQT